MTMALSDRFAAALTLAHELHAGQVRKGTAIPYVSHVQAVAGIVLDYGGDEDEAIAALLHDAVEDCGGAPVLADIRRRFGDRVADIVAACSDTDQTPKPPWQARKEAYLEHLSDAPASVRLVSAADKLHNARTILADYREIGEALWDRFNATGAQTLWYYRALVEAFEAHGRTALVSELARTVAEIERQVKMTKQKQERRVAVKRQNGPALDRNPVASEQIGKRLIDAAQEAIHRLRRGEKPPGYLLDALTRFADDEENRILRIIARNLVIRASEEGLPISRASKDGSKTAFDEAAEKIGKSAAWVEDAYYHPTPRK